MHRKDYRMHKDSRTYSTFLRSILIFALVGLAGLQSFGWGKVGHHLIADVAQSIATKRTIDSVAKYLPNDTWQSASTWMDELRGQKQYAHMARWHYINMEPGETYSASIAKGNNVVHQLNVAIEKLKDRRNLTPEEITLNLKIALHLMGDLHNPLHAGYGSDRGGNTVNVRFDGKKRTLHRVWDTEIIGDKEKAYNDLMFRVKKTRKCKMKRIAKGNSETWFADTRATLPFVYSFESDTLSESYQQQGYRVAQDQLFLSGIRLGRVLNQIFKKY